MCIEKVIAKSGSLKPYKKFEAKIYVLTQRMRVDDTQVSSLTIELSFS